MVLLYLYIYLNEKYTYHQVLKEVDIYYLLLYPKH